jgi:cell division protein FtsI (penicillin-binding protein 3)
LGTDSNCVKLTIDKDLQFLVYEELKEIMNKFEAKEGSVIIMNPENGHIISMLGLPLFDPNDTKNLDLELTKNKTLTNAYEFGSVMKVFVAIAALEDKLITPDELIDCENKKIIKIDGMSFSTWKEHGIITFTEVVEKSNNIGMVKVAKRVGKKLYDHYLRFGFGQKIGIPLGGEQKGYVSPPQKWSKRSIISLAFGYEIASTLLQLARAFCIISNNGFDVKPTLIIDNNESTSKKGKQLYSQETIDIIKKILQNTVTKGTAKKAEIKGYTIMGKTGSANLAINGGYSKLKNIYTFSGIIEKENYKRVIAVYVKEPSDPKLLASMIAAPLFEQIAQKMIIYDKII